MRNLCLLLTALSVAGSPALAQSGAPSTAANGAEQKPATKKVCKRVADVNSIVARKVCREVPVHAATQPAKQVADQPAATAQGGRD